MSKSVYRHGYRLKLYPTEEQKNIIDRFIELYRFVYNWGIGKEEDRYNDKKAGICKRGTYTAYDLGILYTEFRNLPGNEWLKELPKETSKAALRDVYNAYQMFFYKKCRYPKLKSKKSSPMTFKTRYDRFYIDGDRVRFEGLPRVGSGTASIVDTVKLGFDTGFRKSDGSIYIQPSITKDNLGNYWVSFSIKEPVQKIDSLKTEPIGIDVGIRRTMVTSSNEYYNLPKDSIAKLEKKLRKAKRRLHKDNAYRQKEANRTKTKYEDIPVSNRAEKRADKVRKLYKKITNVKLNWYHNTIKEIVTRNPEAIVIETLSIRSMQRKHKHKSHFMQALHTANFYTMHKIIEDKCNKYGIKLIKADKEYPSSQICSTCGYQQDIGNRRLYRCPICGTVIDRDYNAALNLRNLAYVA